MKQYEQGSRFVKTVVDEAGMEVFNKVWTSPETLPTRDEITSPRSWLDRVVDGTRGIEANGRGTGGSETNGSGDQRQRGQRQRRERQRRGRQLTRELHGSPREPKGAALAPASQRARRRPCEPKSARRDERARERRTRAPKARRRVNSAPEASRERRMGPHPAVAASPAGRAPLPVRSRPGPG